MTTPATMFDGLLDDPPAPTQAQPAPANPSDGDLPVEQAPYQGAPTTTDSNPTEKLVQVEGQTFMVDARIDNETIREHLVRQGFANLVGADIRTGTRQHQGRSVPTVDFVKRAGTKG